MSCMPSFIAPCLPRLISKPPDGAGWLHEPKLDGWRIQLHKAGDRVALFTRYGNDISSRLPGLVKMLAALPARSCIIDGELIADEEDRMGDVWSLSRALGAGRDDLCAVVSFDLLYLNGQDLLTWPLIARKRRLEDLVVPAALPSLSHIAPHQDGAKLLAKMEELGLEGVVSKREAAPYRSGRCGEWVKTKCRAWVEANRERWKAFASQAEPTDGR